MADEPKLTQCQFWDFKDFICYRFYNAVLKSGWFLAKDFSEKECRKNGGKSCSANCIGFKELEFHGFRLVN
jgi:hypothetical protein